MQIGWIDFSKTDRDKVMDVLNLLSEQGVLDELGIAQIRDGFANLFFPGTTTIQTRAKYFLMIPYIFKNLESKNSKDFSNLKKELEKLEKNCAKALLKKDEKDLKDDEGVIGKQSVPQGKWVRRPPSNIYWAGLKTYGIFTEDISIDQYLRNICLRNSLKENLSKSGYSKDSSVEGHDDKGAGDIQSSHFWNSEIKYDEDWLQKLRIELTKEESDFLKKQIIGSCPGSMLEVILDNNCDVILKYESFSQLEGIKKYFSDDLYRAFNLAIQFSEFNLVLRILFNVVASGGKSEEANQRFNEKIPELERIANINLESIFLLFEKDMDQKINSGLKDFLLDAQKLMKDGEIEELKDRIKKREISLKGENRSRTCHPEQYDGKWLAGYELNYRFREAKRIIGDIFKSEEYVAEGEFELEEEL